jgi:two-component system, cell cycle sensor histidine kinase and response regulator CckA
MSEMTVAEMSDRLPAVEVAKDTVLVVDDDVAVRRMVRLLLESTDHVVLEAKDGVQALEVARAHHGRIDLLLTDLEMPRMGGLELARLFAQQRPATPVVYMSAPSSTPGACGLLAEGRLFLSKPLRAGRLIFTVREVIGGSIRGKLPSS